MLTVLAFRQLFVNKGRSLLLLLGYGLGVGVMIVLLSVGAAMVDQSKDVSLIGGGEVTVLPQGIDIEAMRTGGLSGLFFSIDRARFLTRQLLGGERNAEAVQRLTQAFELKDAEWVELTEHGPGTPMRAPIYRPETAVVIVIIKLTGHLHAEEARDYSSGAGKPCVMLSGGYNPERVAAEIMEQASSRLK